MDIKKVLLDTDIGSDIDDAVCLAYLLKHPKCKLKGITTVSGKPIVRAKIASSICKAAKREIPIYPGIENPFLVEPRQPDVIQEESLFNWEHDVDFPDTPAVCFMRDEIRKNPHEISLLAIGPMTNVAALFIMDPEIPSLLKELVIMCGTFSRTLNSPVDVQWNSYCDPHAAAVVYNANVKRHISFGRDITAELFWSKELVLENFTAPILKPVLDYSKPWFKRNSRVTFHDPLTAVGIFEPEVCSYEKGDIKVETGSNMLGGYTKFNKNKEGRHTIATSADKDKFFKHFFAVLNG